MLMSNPFKKFLLVSIITFSLLFFSINTNAASCKGSSESACSASSDCYWVNSFKRKDGVQVSAHCRTKAGKNNSAKESKASPSKKEEKLSKEAKKPKTDKAKKDKKKPKKENKTSKKDGDS